MARARQHEESEPVFQEDAKTPDIPAQKQDGEKTAASYSPLSAALEGLYLTSKMLDWAQTRKIARDPARLSEENVFLGEHPSQARVNAYMGANLLGHYLLTKELPEGLKIPLQLATTAETLSGVTQNKRNGLGVNNGALLGGLALTYLLNSKARNEKAAQNKLGLELRKVDNTMVPMMSMQW